MQARNDKNGLTLGKALLQAVYNNKADVVEALVASGAFLNCFGNDGYTPLHSAVINNNPKMIQILLRAGADASMACNGLTPIRLAAENRYWDCVIAFPTVMKDENNKFGYGNALLKAAYANQTQVVKTLVAAGASLNIIFEKDKYTALHCAAYNNNPDMIKILLQAGADINQQNSVGKTAIDLAAGYACWDSVKAFTDKQKSVINQPNQQKSIITSPPQKVEKQVPVIPILKNTLQKALIGTAADIEKMADYYQGRREYGRAMLFSCMAAVFSPLPSEREKYKSYIRNLYPTTWWSVENTKKLMGMQLFLRDCLTAKDYSHYLTELKSKHNISDPVLLILLAIEKLVACGAPILSEERFDFVKTKERINQSIESMLRYDLKLSANEISQFMENKKTQIVKMIQQEQQAEEKAKAEEKQQGAIKVATNVLPFNPANIVIQAQAENQAQAKTQASKIHSPTSQPSVYASGHTLFSSSPPKDVVAICKKINNANKKIMQIKK